MYVCLAISLFLKKNNNNNNKKLRARLVHMFKQCFQFLNNITRIFTYFFIHTYFQKLQTTLPNSPLNIKNVISLSGWYSAPLLESMAHGPSGTSNPFSMGLVGNSHIGFQFSLKSQPCHFVKSLYMKAKAGRANHNMARKVCL